MKLQNLLLPEIGICMESSLYIHMKRKDNVVLLNDINALVFQKYAECSFDTYFNGLTIEKWLKYTNVRKVSLSLKLKGDFEISLLQKEKINNDIIERVISVHYSSSEKISSVVFPFDTFEPKGIFSFKLKALSNEAEYHGGWYEGTIDEMELRDVYLAMDICTFKREEYIKRNLNLLNEKILKNPEHEMFSHLQIFISDNGQTLDIDALNTEKIHIVKNKNYGGVGGFTRGLIEIMMYKELYPATHVLLMDDDVVIAIEALYRTYALLRCLKEKYKNVSIGGAMLRLDKQSIQHESGAVWKLDHAAPLKYKLDLGKVDACLFNEFEEYASYGGWWYYCMSLTVVNDNKLPLPVFIKGDDVEYGIRTGKFITLNGICVWHEPLEKKYVSFQKYYWLRNLLYCNAMHFPGYTKKFLLKLLYKSVIRELMYYRYKDVALFLRAVEDFYKGIEFLEQTDAEELHKDIMESGYKPVPLEQVNMLFNYGQYCYSLKEGESARKRIWRLFLLNGIFLPSKNNRITAIIGCRPINFYRAKRVLQYDEASKKAFVVERNRKETIRLSMELLRITFKILANHDIAMKEFKQNADRITNIVFWKKYLGIN